MTLKFSQQANILTDDATDKPYTVSKAWFWPAVVIALLLLQLIICLITIYFANSDPSFIVEPNYYSRAQDWDQTNASE